tara:strand:- start:3652 stop:4209 length:558 start_codon:yes stop_codon:yes gene_type:complete
MSPPPHDAIKCSGFFGVSGGTGPFDPRAVANPSADALCSKGIDAATTGYCLCSDGLPRFVLDGKADGVEVPKSVKPWQPLLNCHNVCAYVPAYPLRVPARGIEGMGRSAGSKQESNKRFQLTKLAAAMGFFTVGIVLLYFNITFENMDSVGVKALAKLVKATGVSASDRQVVSMSRLHQISKDLR